ncbi:hypothetical protein FNF27_00083 [Cafeteria roenbergensis]|uniref:Uncharacterized protein n=1 Tax=Cafeteria roenbergensis TaxID=33653 RepID=A0A5A8EKR7_CAFRO|nr:hypothetical protein FNF27_00083 [Cafeteria roenbergensis]
MESLVAPPPAPRTVLRDLASSPSTCLDLASDCGRELLVSGSDDGRTTVWDLATSKHWYSWPAHEATVLAVALLSGEDDSEGFRCRMLTHGRDGESLLMVVPGGLESTSSAAVVTATIDVTAAPGDARASADGCTDADDAASAAAASVPALDVDEAGTELVVASAAGRPEVSCVFEPDDPSAEPDQGLGEDGLPKRAGMLMAAALLRCPRRAPADAAAGAADGGEWAVLGYDAGRVSAVRTSDVRGPWSAEPMDPASLARALEPARALVSSTHPALHPVTAVAASPDSSMVAVGTSADFVVLVRVTWEEVTVAREAAGGPAGRDSGAARQSGAGRGLGAVFGGRAARPPALVEHARVVRPRLEPDRAVQLPRAGVSSVAFAMSGRALVAACWDGRVRIFDTSQGLEQAACLAWHRVSAYSLSVGAGPRGKSARFATGDKEGRIAVWDVALDE